MENQPRAFFKLSTTVNCPTCNNQVILFDAQNSEYVVCQTCNSYLHIISDTFVKFNQKLAKTKQEPLLKLGATANIHGTELKVVAYLEKKEQQTTYCWREYILMSLEKGYVTLSEFDGHWNLIAGDKFMPDFKTPISYGVSVGYKDVEYKLFNRYSPVVTSMVGELDWNVIEDKIEASEFIAPPFMVVKEISGSTNKSTDYYIGEYLESDLIAEAFGLDKSDLPNQVGIGANQPSKGYDRWMSSFQVSLLAILITLGLHFTIDIIKPEKELLNSDFSIQFNDKGEANSFKSFVTPSFTIDDNSSNLECEIAANVDNNWFETTIVLVNENDNRTWEVSKGIEYYHGYEEGDSWSEGSTKESVVISDIPKGKYHLNIYPSSGDTERTNLYIKLVANAPMWRNTILTMLAFCIFPAIAWYLMRNFEKRRWNNSDYSPFVNE